LYSQRIVLQYKNWGSRFNNSFQSTEERRNETEGKESEQGILNVLVGKQNGDLLGIQRGIFYHGYHWVKQSGHEERQIYGLQQGYTTTTVSAIDHIHTSK
jgi:hypothetical protein